jgi:hypothetical protein
MDLVFLGDLLNRLDSTDGFKADFGFELGVVSFAFCFHLVSRFYSLTPEKSLLTTGPFFGGHYNPLSGPRLELVHEFEIPESFRKYRLLRPCQWFPDNRSELVFVSDSEAAVFTPVGEELIRFGAKSLKFSQHGGGIMISDVNGDGLEELFLAGRLNNNTLEARVFNQNAFELKRFQVEGSYDPTAESAIDSSNSFLTTNVWDDIDGDGRPEFLAVIRTGHLLQPRSLICFDGQTEEIKWRWDTGAEIVQKKSFSPAHR